MWFEIEYGTRSSRDILKALQQDFILHVHCDAIWFMGYLYIIKCVSLIKTSCDAV